MAAIGTGPTLSDERVRQLLGDAIKLGDDYDARLIQDIVSTHELARLAQEVIDLRTSNGLNSTIAKRVEPLSDALDVANEVIASLGGSRVEPDFTNVERDDRERDIKATGQRGATR